MNQENYWEELAEKAGRVNLDERKMNEWRERIPTLSKGVPNMVGKHIEDCECGYCKPDAVDMLQKSVAKHDGPSPEDYCARLNANYRDAKPGDAVWYEGMSGEKLEKFANYVHEQDKCLPALDHPNIADDSKLGESLSKYYNFVEAKHTEMNLPPLKGFLIFYIDVGTLPPHKAEQFIERMKDSVLKDMRGRLPEEWKTLWIPVRNTDTHVEVLQLNA
jgi:hypothetical protein